MYNIMTSELLDNNARVSYIKTEEDSKFYVIKIELDCGTENSVIFINEEIEEYIHDYMNRNSELSRFCADKYPMREDMSTYMFYACEKMNGRIKTYLEEYKKYFMNMCCCHTPERVHDAATLLCEYQIGIYEAKTNRLTITLNSGESRDIDFSEKLLYCDDSVYLCKVYELLCWLTLDDIQNHIKGICEKNSKCYSAALDNK